MRKLVLFACLMLAGCESKAEFETRRGNWVTQCKEAEFTEKQCHWLFVMAEKAQSDANQAETMAIVYAGSVSTSARRR